MIENYLICLSWKKQKQNRFHRVTKSLGLIFQRFDVFLNEILKSFLSCFMRKGIKGFFSRNLELLTIFHKKLSPVSVDNAVRKRQTNGQFR
jgi:hypothetical protein